VVRLFCLRWQPQSFLHCCENSPTANRQFPGLASHLLEGDDLKPSIAVSVDGEIGPGGIMEPIGEASEVHFLPAIAGGSEKPERRP